MLPYLLLDFISVLGFPAGYCLVVKDSFSKDIPLCIFLFILYRIMFKDLYFFKRTYSIESIEFLFSLLLCSQNSLIQHYYFCNNRFFFFSLLSFINL